ncbi:hypothetical protein M8C21_021436 [Ambrosia artemisiifolia]|uniref:Uncharacterized protein n=1 Tax=Ambrosia artemisiifolia TaxID=4212 RepID=A0AAD5CDU3_AMBAR|nr:hypothetical protein M8C21_021436 [Ambrosia artemisiifolia]
MKPWLECGIRRYMSFMAKVGEKEQHKELPKKWQMHLKPEHTHVSVDSVFEILQASVPKEEKVGKDAFSKFNIHAMFLLR